MADLAAVEEAIVSSIATFLFPSAYTNYTVAASVLGPQVRLMRGWPVDRQLDLDLAAGVTSISVYSLPGVQRNTTRFLKRMAIYPVSQADPTMTATVHNNTVTFAGSASTTQVIGVAIPPLSGYAYRLAANDTPTTVAAEFAAHLPNATASGGVLTIATNQAIRADIGTDTTVLQEVGRQDQMFQVVIWAPSVALRDQFASFVDPRLRNIDHLTLPDGSASGPVKTANGTCSDDVTSKQALWKRTLFFCVEYPTMMTLIEPAMVLGGVTAGGPTYYE